MPRKAKIIRAPRHGTRPTDVAEDSWNVILHARPTAETIKLNVEITATEGENGYVFLLKESKTNRLKESSSEQTDEEWKSVLRAVLLNDPEEEDKVWLGKVEVFANIKNSNIEFAILENVNGIKRRLGTLHIPTGDVEVELWSWLSSSCVEKDALSTSLRESELRASHLQTENDRLTAQIESFISAKTESEKRLILRFTELLNEKKQKLRDVMRSAKVGGEIFGVAGADVEEEESEDEEPRQKLKRKASKTAEELQLEAEKELSEDNATPSDSDVSMTGRATPEHDDDETTDDEGASPPPPPPKSKGKGKAQAKGKRSVSPPTRKGKGKAKRSVSPPTTQVKSEEESEKEGGDADEDMQESGTMEADTDDGDDEL